MFLCRMWVLEKRKNTYEVFLRRFGNVPLLHSGLLILHASCLEEHLGAITQF